MASSSVFCPHCENHVEIQVAAVTRSRQCPECGEVLVLQVAEKSGVTKRKALLVAPTPPVDEAAAKDEPLANRFEGLPEDPFERMRMDPGLLALRRRLLAGVAGVALLVVAAIVVHYAGTGPQASAAAAEARPPAPAVPERQKERKFQHVRPAFLTMSLEERLDRLKSAEVVDEPDFGSQLAPPQFDLSSDPVLPPGSLGGEGRPVFEVEDRAAVVAPTP